MIDESARHRCTRCGANHAQTMLSGSGPLCDTCVNLAISAATGWPDLPPPPQPVEITGPDGRHHVIRFRLVRTPGGVCAAAVEEHCEAQAGYQARTVGGHGAAPDDLIAEVRRGIADMIDRPWLANRADHNGFQIAGDRVEGRIEGESHAGPPKVVIDGRLLTWTEFGDLVSGWEGHGFSLRRSEP